MNLQARKRNMIDYLEGIPIDKNTQEQLIKRALKSNLDYSQGNVKSQKQIESEFQNWLYL